MENNNEIIGQIDFMSKSMPPNVEPLTGNVKNGKLLGVCRYCNKLIFDFDEEIKVIKVKFWGYAHRVCP